MEVFYFPGLDQEKETEGGKGSRSRSEHQATVPSGSLIAAMGKVVETLVRGVGDNHKGHQAGESHSSSVDKLVSNQVWRENTDAQISWRALENIRLCFFKTKTESQWGRRYKVGPENFKRR